MLFSLPTTLQSLLTYFLWSNEPTLIDTSSPLTFTLRHHHAISDSSRVVFANVQSSGFGPEFSFTVPTRHINVHKPESFAAFSAARERSLYHAETMPLDWRETKVVGPDVSSREAIAQLARMTNSTYFQDVAWYDPEWKLEFPFGWEPEADGLRGYIYASTDNSTVIIATKGTSPGWITGNGGPTTKKDKLNDNLLFSCCCARVGPTWSTVCNCFDGGYRCDQTCVENALIEDSLFYPVATNLYNNVTYMYPNANIWVTGHSLGGAVSSLIGATFGVPVVAFESPGEKMAAKRLHLPSPPSTHHITHVYHTGDPLAMGTCTGVTSTCALGGFAMESRCHLGQVIRFDTVQELGWSVNIRSHSIDYVIEHILAESAEWPYDGDDGGEEEATSFWGRKKRQAGKKLGLPEPRPAGEVEGGEGTECMDCFSWEYGNFKNTSLSRRRL